MTDAILFDLPARYSTPSTPRKVRVTHSRKADGTSLPRLPEADLDYLITREYQRQRQLEDIAAHSDEDAAEIARHSLFVEHGIGAPAAAKPFRNGKSKPKPKPKN